MRVSVKKESFTRNEASKYTGLQRFISISKKPFVVSDEIVGARTLYKNLETRARQVLEKYELTFCNGK